MRIVDDMQTNLATMERRAFIKNSLFGAGFLMTAHHPFAGMAEPIYFSNKRERMLSWLEGNTLANYTPAAFFMHFDENHKLGSAAAAKHLEYFRYTNMDFVKIQYEQQYPQLDFLKQPGDWSKLTMNKLDFYEPQLQAVREIVKAVKKEAFIVMTLYSPFMWAGHCATLPVLLKHMEENPDAVKRGLDVLTESQLLFAHACMEIGVDGFYMSTQGSETNQFTNPELFTKYVKPADLVTMKEVNTRCPFNILHVCDYNGPYENYNRVIDYPGQVVNCNPQLTGKTLSWQEISTLFKRPAMGGMSKKGIIYKGSYEIEKDVRHILKNAPKQFILGAECTLPGDINLDNVKKAISVAHSTGR
jgi:uroporphyrinogen decarboxylase